eukprot:TRINITY_DN3371_c0_g1_i3.p1 TRINITY_DN3371_c0_g1~~TRINITY_DN3371_c0_g1_i3.p1  ORF type:complete len:224 (-),score=15.15 TRINITY_DN3371_c0_g1_i3:114-764(-)
MIRRPPRSTHCISSAASDVYKRQQVRLLVEQANRTMKELEFECGYGVGLCFVELELEVLAYVDVLDSLAELLERYHPVIILIELDDGSVYELLQLRVLQICSHHHLQHFKQLPIRNVAVAVHVVDVEHESYFVLQRPVGVEGTEAGDKLGERDLAVFVLVEHIYHSVNQRVLRQFLIVRYQITWHIKELIRLQSSRSIRVKLFKLLVESFYFFFGN